MKPKQVICAKYRGCMRYGKKGICVHSKLHPPWKYCGSPCHADGKPDPRAVCRPRLTRKPKKP